MVFQLTLLLFMLNVVILIFSIFGISSKDIELFTSFSMCQVGADKLSNNNRTDKLQFQISSYHLSDMNSCNS
jgi:hypothetical protein